MHLEEYKREKHLTHWERFIKTAPMATFLHSRAFLSYHGDRFRDQSLMVYDRNELVAIFVAANSEDDARIIVSHPGITYGGLLHQGMMGGNEIVEIFRTIISHYRTHGYAGIRYKAIPSFYHRMPCEEDVWALTQLGFENTRTDLGRTINLTTPLIWGDKRQRGLVKSRKAGVTLSQGSEHAEEVWRITSDNLSRKHGQKPAHTLDEIRLILERCPENLDWIVARLGDEPVAGAMLFITPTVVHVQYGSSSAQGYELGALEMVYYKAIEYAQEMGKQYFSFGISTEQEGRFLNESLDRFKKKFSAGGVCYQFYSLSLLD